VSRRARIASFGSATLLVIVGGIAGPLVGGATGELILFLLAGAGFVTATLLAFLEVGLSEDRDRAKEAEGQSGVLATSKPSKPPEPSSEHASPRPRRSFPRRRTPRRGEPPHH
jgi:hypothetical protein